MNLDAIKAINPPPELSARIQESSALVGIQDNQGLKTDAIGLWAGTLALAEVGIGSLMHAFRIPLTGTMLSLNQGLFLSRITRLNRERKDAKRLGFEVSSVTALLKSFAPIGKRLTPMLAIASQGLLFSFGVSFFGVNLAGVIIGSMLLAVWGIAQPAILAGVMFSAISEAEQTKIMGAWNKMLGGVEILQNFSVLDGIVILLAVKCTIAGILAMIAWQSEADSPHRFWSKWESLVNRRIQYVPSPNIIETPLKTNLADQMTLALKDLKNPIIWLSIGIMMALSYFMDSELAPAVWMAMRALAGIYTFYLVVRLLPWDRLLNPDNKNTASLRSAILVLKGTQNTDPSHQHTNNSYKA